MVEAYRQADAGKIDLSEPVELADGDKVPGSGILTEHFSAGLQLSLRDAIRLMIAYSDNTATNLVLERIGLPSTAATMEQLGLPNTKIHAKVFRSDTSVFPERSRQFGLGSTTAAETVRLLELIYRKEAAGSPACEEMLEHLRACEDDASLPRFLPEGTKVAFKTGAVTAARTAGGIIESPRGPIAVCVLTSENEDKRWSDENAGKVLCAQAARAAYEYFNADSPVVASEGQLATGASGWLVEALQRTLNERLAPSPNLTVDGEFGPATREAVIALQKKHDIEPAGVVDGATWKALGPLIPRDRRSEGGGSTAGSVAEKRPADPLDGPPFVTSKAWVVADAKTGEIVGGENDSRPLDIASTTKLMTAWIVLQLAEKDAAVLEDAVCFSRRADETPGSTTAVREGERLPVRDLLYGLLLPSGNDASVALAEHFGGRFAPPENDPEADDPLERFVAEMNRTAAKLGMEQTQYKNPHGLTAQGHKSTARDMVRLARVACGDRRLLDYVGTRSYACTVEGAPGYLREIAWENTNQLLEIEGYHGIKTGTTSAAGACLISLGERDSERLIVVVLGSSSSDARYTDTRNLFRWAWRQRGQAE
jgi:D-alanyl-D-alanine carboxypeptidase (penicillin-binding protein 5/6)